MTKSEKPELGTGEASGRILTSLWENLCTASGWVVLMDGPDDASKGLKLGIETTTMTDIACQKLTVSLDNRICKRAERPPQSIEPAT